MAATDNEKNINDGFTQQEEEVEFKSKTQLKRESEALQKLGTELVNLTEASLKKMPLDDELFDAISQAQRINRKKDGFRRQLQFIGKLMRSRDCDPIALALTRLKAPHQAETQAFHKLETMRDDMLKNGDDAVQAALESHPQLDRQKLRQLVRQAKKEQSLSKPPKSARELFKYLKENIQE